jgi:hypothetical protein
MRLFNEVFWISLLAGGILGLVAARIRLMNSPLQGKRWVVVLACTAGSLVGAVVFLSLALASAVWDHPADRAGSWELMGPTLLILLFLFVGFSLRRP